MSYIFALFVVSLIHPLSPLSLYVNLILPKFLISFHRKSLCLGFLHDLRFITWTFAENYIEYCLARIFPNQCRTAQPPLKSFVFVFFQCVYKIILLYHRVCIYILDKSRLYIFVLLFSPSVQR